MDENKNAPKEIYVELYDKFHDEYRRGMVSGEEVGEVIMRLASCYAKYNLNLVRAEKALSAIAVINEMTIDENGKPISSAKAKIVTEATEESFQYNLARAHVNNIEAFINALKALQKGVLNEYASSL